MRHFSLILWHLIDWPFISGGSHIQEVRQHKLVLKDKKNKNKRVNKDMELNKKNKHANKDMELNWERLEGWKRSNHIAQNSQKMLSKNFTFPLKVET